MKKFMSDLIVTENTPLNDQYFLLKLKAENELPVIMPGQFAEVKVEDSPSTFLRRPISINYVDRNRNEIWLLIQIVGPGTLQLSKLRPGKLLNLIYPLGNSFTYPVRKDANLLLVGGGVGIAPMLFWGAQLAAEGFHCNFLIGGRSQSNLLLLDEFKKYGEVYCTTEDGSSGEKGFVIHHSLLQNQKFDAIYTCGPTPMMKAVAGYAADNAVFCEVSLENTMACGFGACLCCVTDTTDGHVCVCTEGPVFNITKLKW
ncbi:MAG: dihydroorotate dehydrogenase electron transfer subunit [Paludibacter sp. 47-17]|jgi:dihydroorotate dehydrogenase electron transfer subunit|nr:MAG: dihydroorotate dehydrogenase electron transfer subunit [Paludibacter sp. 47-17]